MKNLIKKIEGLKLETHPEETEYRFGFRDGNNTCVVSVKNILTQHNIGELSDGYHTFNSLYEQRMYLFATIVNQNKDKAWKSFKHEDGELCFGGGWFIVGVDTPKGSYTYHYENKYWNLFECQELECGKKWDGHTDKDVNRMLSLANYNLITISKQLGCPLDNMIRLLLAYKQGYVYTKDVKGKIIKEEIISQVGLTTDGEWCVATSKGFILDKQCGKTWWLNESEVIDNESASSNISKS